MYLGIDLGTSSVKALLVDESGVVRATGRAPYPLRTPEPGWAEQDPEDWWSATAQAVRGTLDGQQAASVKAIGLSGQMHTLVLLDESGKPVRPAIAWPDVRTTAEVEAFHAGIDRETLVQVLGNAPATGFTALGLMWVKRHEPQAYRSAAWLLLPKDYLRYRLTGNIASEATDASATLLFDVPRRDWAWEVVQRLGLSRNLLPPLAQSSEPAGLLSPEASDALGLPSDIPVMTGAGDQAAAAVGCSLLDPGFMLITLGSGGQVFAPLLAPHADPSLRIHLFCHAPADRWHLLGAVQNVGLALNWVRRLLGWSWERFMAEAAAVPCGANDLLFLPYLTGERTPHMDPLATGAFHGLRLSHGPPHLARAALEGVSCAVALAVEACLAAGASAETLVLTGGGARHALQRNLLADALGRPLYAAQIKDASARGAAVLAGAPAMRLSTELVAEPGAYSAHMQELAHRLHALYAAVRQGFRR